MIISQTLGYAKCKLWAHALNDINRYLCSLWCGNSHKNKNLMQISIQNTPLVNFRNYSLIYLTPFSEQLIHSTPPCTRIVTVYQTHHSETIIISKPTDYYVVIESFGFPVFAVMPQTDFFWAIPKLCSHSPKKLQNLKFVSSWLRPQYYWLGTESTFIDNQKWVIVLTHITIMLP